LHGGQPGEGAVDLRAAQATEVVELGQAETGRVDGRDGAVAGRGPATQRGLLDLDPFQRGRGRRSAGPQVGQPRSLHRVTVRYDVSDRGIDVYHERDATAQARFPLRVSTTVS
jgi:hypothetical protein